MARYGDFMCLGWASKDDKYIGMNWREPRKNKEINFRNSIFRRGRKGFNLRFIHQGESRQQYSRRTAYEIGLVNKVINDGRN